MFSTASQQLGNPAGIRQRIDWQRLQAEFLISEVGLSLTMVSMASTYRLLGNHQHAEQCLTFAHKGYKTAAEWLETLRLNGIDSEMLTRRMAILEQELKQFKVDEPEADTCALAAQDHGGQPSPPLPQCKTCKPAATERLTPREQEVLQLIADGESTRQIATKLGITFKTAVCHRANIMNKIGAPNAASLVRHAIRFGLVQP